MAGRVLSLEQNRRIRQRAVVVVAADRAGVIDLAQRLTRWLKFKQDCINIRLERPEENNRGQWIVWVWFLAPAMDADFEIPGTQRLLWRGRLVA